MERSQVGRGVIEKDWTSDMSLEFLALYEKYSVLWFPAHKDHKNRHALHQAWTNLQQEFGVDISLSVLKRKKESLMASYRFIRRKMLSAKASGKPFKSHWFAYRAVDRIMKKVRLSENSSDQPLENGGEGDEEEEDEEEEEYEDESEWSLVENHGKPHKLQETVLEVGGLEDNDLSNQSLELQFVNSKFEKISPKRKATARKSYQERKKAKIKYEESDVYALPEEFVQSNVTDSYAAADSYSRADSCAMYCQLLAEKLRGLNARTRIIVQNKIDNLMFQAILEEMDIPTTSRSKSWLAAQEAEGVDAQPIELTDLEPQVIEIQSSLPSTKSSTIHRNKLEGNTANEMTDSVESII